MQENQSNTKLDQRLWEEFLGKEIHIFLFYGYEVWIQWGMSANKAEICRYGCVDWCVTGGTGYRLISL